MSIGSRRVGRTAMRLLGLQGLEARGFEFLLSIHQAALLLISSRLIYSSSQMRNISYLSYIASHHPRSSLFTFRTVHYPLLLCLNSSPPPNPLIS